MHNTKSVREQGLDKFYTKRDVAGTCISRVKNWDKWELVVEPSAGNGSFLSQIPSDNKIGIDIEPESDTIKKMNFFDYSPPKSKNILVIGNPPFGVGCSTAVKFFNHAAQWSDCIAFIIPRTFKRISVQNRLNEYFHVVHDEDVPTHPCAFEPPMSVKCCFQIWERKDNKRDIIKMPCTHDDWDFLTYGPKDTKGQPTPPNGADFALLAYGGACGRVTRESLGDLRPKSWHWIKSKIDVHTLIKRFESLDYSISKDTARQNSLGKSELVHLYSSSFDHN